MDKVGILEIQAHGLSKDEYEKIVKILDKNPNIIELGMIASLWKEECSYKSTKSYLKTISSKLDHVICGMGENAGVINIDDGDALAIKLSSLGVDEAIKGIFSMNARPIAIANHLNIKDVYSKKITDLALYCNNIGIPTIAYDASNCQDSKSAEIINSVSIGILKRNKIIYSGAFQTDADVVYIGNKTGRDGVIDLSKISENIDNPDLSIIPKAYIDDGYFSNILMEMILELMRNEVILSIKDMEYAGITYSAMHMASKSGRGVDISIENIPVIDEKMTAYEIMTSNSFGRMLAVTKPEKRQILMSVAKKWNIEISVIGKITETGNIIVKKSGEVQASIPVSKLYINSPKNDINLVELSSSNYISDLEKHKNSSIVELEQKIISSQKQELVKSISGQINTSCSGLVIYSGNNIGIVKIPDTNGKAASISIYSPYKYFNNDPVRAVKSAIAICYRNIIATGAEPKALTNGMNFDSINNTKSFSEFAAAISGISETCPLLNVAVVSGSINFKDNMNSHTVICMIGILKDYKNSIMQRFYHEGDIIISIGHLDSIEGIYSINLEHEVKVARFILNIAGQKLVNCCRSVDDTGIIGTIINMSTDYMKYELLPEVNSSELIVDKHARYLICINDLNKEKLIELIRQEKLSYKELGKVIKR